MTTVPHAQPGKARQPKPPHRMRRLALVVLVVVVAAGALEAIPGFPGHPQASLLGDLGLADAGAVVARATAPIRGHPTDPCAKLDSEFAVGNHLLRGTDIGWYASIWPTYQALQAMYVASLRAGSGSCARDFEAVLRAVDQQYWDTSYGGGPAAFDQGPHAFHTHADLPRVDDSLWMGLANMQGYQMSGDRAFLERAEAVFRLATREWDARRGGTYWEYHTVRSRNLDKAIVSNAPTVVLGAALFSVTGHRSYLTWSSRVLRWTESSLLDPSTGLYDDHRDDRTDPPTVDTVKLTYDQGIMVGAMAALARVDPGQFPLQDAVALARRSMEYFGAHHRYGHPDFDAVWAANLLATVAVEGDPGFARQARGSVELALRAAPAPSGRLGPAGALSALRALSALPPNRYADLSYLALGGHAPPPPSP